MTTFPPTASPRLFRRNQEALIPYASTLVTVWKDEFTTEGTYLVSPELGLPCEADIAVMSWNVDFLEPGSGTFTAEIRTETTSGWGPWVTKFVNENGSYRSVPGGKDPDAQEQAGMKACQIRFRIEGRIVLWNASVTFLKSRENRQPIPAGPYSLGKRVVISDVPRISQLQEDERADQYPRQDPKRENRVGHWICSPAALDTLIGFYGAKINLLEVSRAVYDPTTKLFGVWALNVAAVRRFVNAYGVVVKVESMEQLEQEIFSQNPVVISMRWAEGELDNACIPTSKGHLVTVIGFTQEGNVITHDTCTANLDEVPRQFDRNQFWNAWQNNADGIAYLVF